ncbi:hypothetical protein HOC13_02020 [Candidatus Woesearchaeota archaeon]|jgi:leucyl aminopeptidase (aminopeptidase T)|nr:hypothetical protein [Candidatus Woesearchaeota archaeon]MBT7706822.1 hypothetical protein [archaeon]
MVLNPNLPNIVLNKILSLNSTEHFLLVTDTSKEPLAQPFYDLAKQITPFAEIVIMQPLSMHGQEPPQNIAEKMFHADVLLILTEKSLSHTDATRTAVKNNARGISSPNISEEILNRCVDIDYNQLISFHDWLRPIIANSETIQVTTKQGTNITFSITETHGYSDHLLKNKPGAIGNLPTGEVDSGIKNANGKIVIDGSFPFLGLLREPIYLEVKNNQATIISENNPSNKLKEILQPCAPNSNQLAEFGIGTNPKAILTGKVIEDEKVKGTIHFALGNDLSYGGKNNIPLHLDGVITKPTIIVDGKTIMEEGNFLQ